MSWLCNSVHQTVCNGKTFPIEGKQLMEWW
jgi:hypothetical protein